MPVSSLAFIGVKYSSDPSAESGFLWGENFFDALGVMAEREQGVLEGALCFLVEMLLYPLPELLLVMEVGAVLHRCGFYMGEQRYGDFPVLLTGWGCDGARFGHRIRVSRVADCPLVRGQVTGWHGHMETDMGAAGQGKFPCALLVAVRGGSGSSGETIRLMVAPLIGAPVSPSMIVPLTGWASHIR